MLISSSPTLAVVYDGRQYGKLRDRRRSFVEAARYRPCASRTAAKVTAHLALNFRQSSLNLGLFLEIFEAAKCSFERALSFRDLIGFQVGHCQMVLQDWVVWGFRDGKLELIAGQNVIAKMDPRID